MKKIRFNNKIFKALQFAFILAFKLAIIDIKVIKTITSFLILKMSNI